MKENPRSPKPESDQTMATPGPGRHVGSIFFASMAPDFPTAPKPRKSHQTHAFDQIPEDLRGQ